MKLYILDTETTGLKNDYHELTEISIIRCDDLIQKVWMIKIKYPKRASPQALEVTGKTVEELMGRGRYIEEIIPEIDMFLKEDGLQPDDRIAMAYNCSFDRRFINSAYKDSKKQFPVTYWIDAKEQARKFVKNLNFGKVSLSQENMLKIANVKNVENNSHTAEGDSRNLYRLHKVFQERGISNTEFIKMDPDLLVDLDGKNIVKTSVKKTKQTKNQQSYDENDIVAALDINNSSTAEEELENTYDPCSIEED